MTASAVALAARAGDGVADALDEQRAVGEAGDRVVEGLVRELLLEGLALADVAAVEDDAADVLVVEQVRVQDLELPRRSPSRWRSEHSSDLAGGAAVGGAVGEQVQQAALLARRRAGWSKRVPIDLVGACSRARARSTGSGRRSCASASSTVIRSLACWTSEPKRASLARRWTSSVSAALSSASETWVASARSALARRRGRGVLAGARRAGRAPRRAPQAETTAAVVGAEAQVGAALGGERRTRGARPRRRRAARRRSRARAARSLARSRRLRPRRLQRVVLDEAQQRRGVRADERRDRVEGGVAISSRAVAATSAAPAALSVRSRATERSCWRTRPAMRATTRPNRTTDAPMMTIRSMSLPRELAATSSIDRRDQRGAR